jgi:ubiquinol-cytochrome c reductase iron-sulfur subunit
VDGVLTVFPEGHVGSADGQTLLIHVGEGRLQLTGERAGWAPEGFVAYSKVCTHAGCPVGLYRASQASLICPCHQSTFDVLRGAVPTFGPAARPLPQLPIQLVDGEFRALGDFPEPVGPSFWDLTRDEGA